MVFVSVSIRDVDPKVFREFKAKTVTQGTKTGTAVTQALKEWTQKNEKKGSPKKSFFSVKPWDWGKGNENLSNEIDAYLYGGKK